MKKSYVILSILLVLFVSYFLSVTRESRGLDLRVLAISSFNIIPDNAGERYVGTGLADTVITKLSTIEGLRLIERTQLERAKKRIGLGQDEMITEEIAFKLADMLKADIVMLGTIQTSRDKFKVSTKTLDVKTKDIKVFTSDSIYMGEGVKGIENNIEPLNNVHDQIAKNVTDMMGVQLSEKQEELVKKDFTASGPAYISYAKARDFYVKYTKEDNEKAIELFQDSINKDPSYALAYAGLGDALALKVGAYLNKDMTFIDKSIEAGKKAIELEPELPEGYKALALAYTYKYGNTQDEELLSLAITNYEKALEINPYYLDANLNLGRIYLTEGDIDEALAKFQKTVELDYGYSAAHTYLAYGYIKKEEYNKAIEEFNKVLLLEKEMKTPYSTIALTACVNKAVCYEKLHNFDAALNEYETLLKINPDYPPVHAMLGTFYFNRDEKEKARIELELYLKLDPEGEFVDSVKKVLEDLR